MARGVLAILGSGETAPGMTKVHRGLLARHEPVRAVNLDSSYGFQLNVPQMSEKLEEYFKVSLQIDMTTLHLTSFHQSSELERTLFKQRIRQANYVFAGPGSPSYALNQWSPLNLGEDLLHVLDEDGTLCIASAAALTLGAFTAPIYEIYKVGVEPYWLPGLNILTNYGLNCVVIPHFDNNEGGNYDTRYCYLGQPRLEGLEQQLPMGVATLGIDEHTALIFDFANDTLSVEGKSNCYWRQGNESRILENGSTTSIDELRTTKVVPRVVLTSEIDLRLDMDPSELGRVILEGGPSSLSAVAQLVQLAESGGEGFIDPSSLIEGLLAARRSARDAGLFDLADQLRDVLLNARIEVNDAVDGTTWSLH
jgi:hypothetical protein